MDHVKIKKGEQLFRDMLSVIDSLNRFQILSEASLTPARTFSEPIAGPGQGGTRTTAALLRRSGKALANLVKNSAKIERLN